MPVISYFFGIYIRMYQDDHNPPHFHVEYQGHEALRQLKPVMFWREITQ